MRPKRVSILARKYGRLVKSLLLLGSIVLITSYIYKIAETSDAFAITRFSHSGVVKYVNKADFENLIKANIADQTYFGFDSANFETQLKANFLAIKSVKVLKKPFNYIEVHIQERTPVAVVVDNQADRYLIDEQGYVLGLIDQAYLDLPVVSYNQKVFVGKFIDKNIVPLALEILNAAKLEQVQMTSLSFKPDFAEFYTDSGIHTLIGFVRSASESLKIVAALLEHGRRDNQKITKIDLRYEKVIVSYE